MRHALAFATLLATVVLAGCAERTSNDAKAAVAAAPVAAAPDTGVTLVPIDSAALLALTRDGRARVTVVNMWATWCVPCRQEFPELMAAARAHQAEGVRLVLVSADFDDHIAEIHRFLNSQGVHDTTYLKRQTDQVFIDALNPKWTGTIPATFVYDASGRRVAFWEGRADRARFEAAIRHALEEAPSATKENRS